jgi:hypothetical protein
MGRLLTLRAAAAQSIQREQVLAVKNACCIEKTFLGLFGVLPMPHCTHFFVIAVCPFPARFLGLIVRIQRSIATMFITPPVPSHTPPINRQSRCAFAHTVAANFPIAISPNAVQPSRPTFLDLTTGQGKAITERSANDLECDGLSSTREQEGSRHKVEAIQILQADRDEALQQVECLQRQLVHASHELAMTNVEAATVQARQDELDQVKDSLSNVKNDATVVQKSLECVKGDLEKANEEGDEELEQELAMAKELATAVQNTTLKDMSELASDGIQKAEKVAAVANTTMEDLKEELDRVYQAFFKAKMETKVVQKTLEKVKARAHARILHQQLRYRMVLSEHHWANRSRIPELEAAITKKNFVIDQAAAVVIDLENDVEAMKLELDKLNVSSVQESAQHSRQVATKSNRRKGEELVVSATAKTSRPDLFEPAPIPRPGTVLSNMTETNKKALPEEVESAEVSTDIPCSTRRSTRVRNKPVQTPDGSALHTRSKWSLVIGPDGEKTFSANESSKPSS